MDKDKPLTKEEKLEILKRIAGSGQQYSKEGIQELFDIAHRTNEE